MKLLLHACCGPCSLGATKALDQAGIDYSIDYANPNIYPAEEYERRLEALRDFVCTPQGIKLHVGDYDPSEWEEKVAVFGLDREKRCRACYRLRFEKVAKRAVKLGYDAIASTLTISPYQFTQVILEELERAARKEGITAELHDFSEMYPYSTKTSRDLGMYRQNYCGCRFSIGEAEAERRARKAAAEARKALKHRAMLQAASEGIVNQASQL